MKAAAWVKTVLVLMASGVFAAQVYAISDSQKEAIAERIKPVGEVCVEGDASCASASASAGGAQAARSGEEIYNTACTACHATGAAGAPKLGDSAAWADRIAKGKETLYDHSINGFNGMPAKGLCMDCSDDELKATVDYMVENSQ